MLQAKEPEDYVLAANKSTSVRDFCELAFQCVGLEYNDYVIVDQQFYRNAEVDVLLGDASKAKEKLGWMPKTSLEELVGMMVNADFERQESTG